MADQIPLTGVDEDKSRRPQTQQWIKRTL